MSLAHRLPLALLLLGQTSACSDYELGQQDTDDPLDAALFVEPELLDFGLLEPGVTATEVVTLTATGTMGLELEPLVQTGSGAFEVVWDDGDPDMSPGESRELLVSYTPVNLEDEGLLRLGSDAGEGAVQLFGGGLWPAVAVDPGTIELITTTGEPVQGQAWVESVGTATLELGTWMMGDSEVFDAQLDAPVSLAPGEGTWLDVTFSPPDHGTWTTEVLIATNTPTGQALVPVIGEYPPPCLGLAEAWDRGLLDLSMNSSMNIVVGNESEDYDLCIDTWYLYLGEQTQDAGAGDPFYDPGADYPMGSITVAPGETHTFVYGLTKESAWWCVEELQVTQATQSYEFAGYRVPSLLLEPMLDGDQDEIWYRAARNPVVLVGRNTHYLNVESEAPAGYVEIESRNLGRVEGTGWIEEHVPAGYKASGFSLEPDNSASDGAGGMVYTWVVDFEAAVDTDINIHTQYDVRTWSYTLQVTDAELVGRQLLPEPTAWWEDSDGLGQTSSGSPLVVEIQ